MWVYKVTNQINGKVYIGQSIRPIQERWHRHVQDAESGRLDTHFARAIRYYGSDKFICEEIDSAETQEELTKKEYQWIKYYNSVEDGYNSTDAEYKCGGNTYINKTPEEMAKISNKIRDSKLGEKNPNARAVKCKSIITGEELHFNTAKEMQNYFQHGNHNFVTRRCNGTIKCLFKKEWLIAYEENDYPTDYTIEKTSRKSVAIRVINLETEEEKEFPSYAAAERYFGEINKYFSGAAYKKETPEFIKGHYKITILK